MSFIRDAIQVLSGMRKFSVMMCLVTLGGVFRLASLYTAKKYQFEFISGAEMVDLLRYTAVAYFSANTLEHMTKAIRDWATKKGKSVVEEVTK